MITEMQADIKTIKNSTMSNKNFSSGSHTKCDVPSSSSDEIRLLKLNIQKARAISELCLINHIHEGMILLELFYSHHKYCQMCD